MMFSVFSKTILKNMNQIGHNISHVLKNPIWTKMSFISCIYTVSSLNISEFFYKKIKKVFLSKSNKKLMRVKFLKLGFQKLF